ncbi:MAG TPA: proteasome assembly chaperone family protein [Nitrososphaeraceae archaeon]|nr:proteasome assembly chaperone family protein [Nitrososphaeraceae archaeon]
MNQHIQLLVRNNSFKAIIHRTLYSLLLHRILMLPSRTGVNVIYSLSDLPNIDSPYLICGFPGSGYVGKIAVDHLIQELKAKHLADVYSTSFPPQVLIRTDGTADLMKNSIFYSKDSNTNILLLTGDSQPVNPDSEYVLAEEILDIAAKFNTKHVFTLAAYITGVFVDKPRIFGTATDADIVKSFYEKNISTMDVGSITGMNGLIIGIAKLRGMRGTCLLGETSGYVVDAKASKSILETLLSIVGIKIDMATLEKRAKDTEMLIKTIEQQMAGRTGRLPEGQQAQPPGKSPNMGYIS